MQFQASLPGPGTYGDGGIPSARLDDKNRKSFCTVGVMEGGSERSDKVCKEVSNGNSIDTKSCTKYHSLCPLPGFWISPGVL